MTKRTSIVVTSISEPNPCLKRLAIGAKQKDWNFLIIGDSKSPKKFFLDGAQFFDLKTQRKLDFKLSSLCPIGHYTRKNIGYLLAVKDQPSAIVETDDDNIPLDQFWEPREEYHFTTKVKGTGWFNVYSLYTEKQIWPRGLPLEHVLATLNIEKSNSLKKSFCPIQQGLADGNPDVDAIFRMTHKLPITFDKRTTPVQLSSGLWSPFNSQNTTWFKKAFPLLYLPSYCTFRMTDIWRSFIAQRIAWECNWQLMFHDTTVFQDRNQHNLLSDFQQEIPGYLLNDKIKRILEETSLRSGVDHIGYNLLTCYNSLVKEKIITKGELKLVKAWLNDFEKIV